MINCDFRIHIFSNALRASIQNGQGIVTISTVITTYLQKDHNVVLENCLALAQDGCFWGEKEKLQVKALSKLLLIEVLYRNKKMKITIQVKACVCRSEGFLQI